MSIIKEISDDVEYAYAVTFENAKSEFEFDEKNRPVVALHGLGGGWAKKGFREYMTVNDVGGILTYFGEMTNGLDKYVDRLNNYLEKYSNPVIVGFSAGGIIALKYAEKYGWNKFKKIITVATPLFGSPPASKLTFLGETFKELSVGSLYLNRVRDIKPPKGKVLSVFAEKDLKAPFKNIDSLNWPIIITKAQSHGEIHSNWKIIEPIINKEIGLW